MSNGMEFNISFVSSLTIARPVSKKRVNIVLTHDKNFKAGDAIIVHSMEELREELKKYPSEDIYVIGGETIYKQLLDDCDVAHITKILSDRGVNIAFMRLFREGKGHTAYTIVESDERLPEGVDQLLLANPNINDVMVVQP